MHFLFPCLLCNSCWIKSDDGAIAAFIVPIVAIILVQLKLQLNCNKLILLQINCVFLVITLKVIYKQRTVSKQDASNKDTVKYKIISPKLSYFISFHYYVTEVY